MVIWIGLLLISSWLLVLAANLLVNQTKALASYFKLSKLFVSLVLMAIGTSLPELTVSSIALVNHDTGLAIGNILGSNITNATLIFGVGILMGGLRIGTTKTQQNSWLLVFITTVFVALFLLPIPIPTVGALLIGLAIGSVIWQYIKAVQGRDHEDKLSLVVQKFMPQSPWMAVAKAILGVAVLVFSGLMLVICIEGISSALHITTTVLGLTLAALATSLPELVTTIVAQRQGEAKIAVGNILGSNIYNLAFIGGVLSLRIKSFELTTMEFVYLAITTLALFGIIKFWKGQVVPQSVGIILIISYAIYLITVAWS